MSGKLYRAPAPSEQQGWRQRSSDAEEDVDWVEDSASEQEYDEDGSLTETPTTSSSSSLSGRKRKQQMTDEQELEQLMRRHASANNNSNARHAQAAASGRLEPGARMVFDKQREDYQQASSQSPALLQQTYKPPYLEPLDNRELAELNDFFQKYSQRSQELNKDNVWTFIRLISGFTKQPLEVTERQ